MFHSGAPKVQRAILNERAWARRPPGVQPAEAGGFRRKRAEEDPELAEFLGNAAVRVGSGSGPGRVRVGSGSGRVRVGSGSGQSH